MEEEREERGEFGELLIYTFSGFLGGLVLGTVLDWKGFQMNAVGQWAVRTLAGEGESLLEGLYALRRRFQARVGSMAEAYGWGKFLGMGIPWGIDAGSRMLGMDIYGVEGFYIAYFYAMSDQIGAAVSGALFLRREERTWWAAIKRYLHHPVMLTGLCVILIVPVGLLALRLGGFSPTTQVRTALETIGANLCWLPPLMGWLWEKKKGD
ncbi:MAG TPA: hypothetical protein DCS11_09600 [Syntrophus sp. (in: bacteria)]|jgi:hypothetical protein|nr:hypothetical protein [Syntrophus sp. (in: bacteria)]